jgi:hypothetical protein
MIINHKKAKERLTIVFITLVIYVIITEPVVRWFYLEETNPLSTWYFAILLPIFNLLFYGFIFLLFYGIINLFMWVLVIKGNKE